MRSAEQVIAQLLSFAARHDAIRAVVMNGSRVNPNAPQDLFCDFDVVYFVANPRQFLEDQSWIPYFGDLVILQQNDYEDHGIPGYIFLMLFSDGVRIDLSFNGLPNLAYLSDDTLTRVLLDKDGRIPPLPPSSDEGYILRRPGEKEFAESLNEIFWCSNNVAKGIWRDELTYVRYMYDVIIRECLLKVLEWYAAMRYGWSVDPGKFGKWLKRYLPPEMYAAVGRTYSGPGYAETWDALFEALALTRQAGQALASDLGYPYPLDDDRRTVAYLRQVRALPPDALSFE